MPAIEHIECPQCSRPTKATRVGTQDYCDVYTCKEGHLIRIHIDRPRKEWNELASRDSGPTQGT